MTDRNFFFGLGLGKVVTGGHAYPPELVSKVLSPLFDPLTTDGPIRRQLRALPLVLQLQAGNSPITKGQFGHRTDGGQTSGILRKAGYFDFGLQES